jgi:hypothetical protein
VVTKLETQGRCAGRNHTLPIDEQLGHFAKYGSQHECWRAQPERASQLPGKSVLELPVGHGLG